MDCSDEMMDSMLSDVVISRAYNHFIKSNAMLFKDKIVLDVGCRSGMLSLMTVEAGAIKVIALGNMKSAEYVKQALAKGEKEDIFEAIDGVIEKIVLPCGLKKVDIIVSEWMGHAIFTESLIQEVIYARDKWLVKGGDIIPNVAQLYIAGISYHPRFSVDQNILPRTDNKVNKTVSLMEDHVPAQKLMTKKCQLTSVNLSTDNCDNFDFMDVEFEVQALRDGDIRGFVLYFDVGFANARGKQKKLFSIGPKSPKTHLKQTLLFPDERWEVQKDQLLEGHIEMCANADELRGVEFSLGMKMSTDEGLN